MDVAETVLVAVIVVVPTMFGIVSVATVTVCETVAAVKLDYRGLTSCLDKMELKLVCLTLR